MATEQTKSDVGISGTASPDRDTVDTSQQRALVTINPTLTERHVRSRLSDAMFLAHMFATKFRAPQTCEKRRAAPGDADASYRKATQPAVRTGRIVSRKV